MRNLHAPALVLALFAFAVHAQTTTTVMPADLGPWQEQNSTCGVSNTGDTGFQLGPGSPPLGAGSALITVGSDGDSFNSFRYTGANGVALTSLTELGYSTYVQVDGSGGQAAYLLLNIDYNGDDQLEDQLFFEPVYQNGTYGGDPVPNQGNVATGTWQTWDALAGGWWSANDGFGGPPLHTLAGYATLHPTARIINTNTGQGGLRVAAGCGGAAWANFVGNFDAVRVGVSGTTNQFDFETTPSIDSISDVSQNEGNGGTTNFIFTLTLSHAVSQQVTVDYTLADGSAVAPGDYDGTGGTATFAANTTSTIITVPVVGDLVPEPNENFFVNLTNPQNAILGNDTQAEGTILNDDTPFALLTMTKDGPATAAPGTQITYTIVINNTGNIAAGDNPGNELTDILPPELTLVSAAASSGTAVANIPTNTVTWNGSVAAGGTLTITITALVEAVAPGTTITNQASLTYDTNGDGINDTTIQSDNPDTGTPGDPTTTTVGAAVAGIPTASELALLLLAMSLAMVAIFRMR
jgi:uncharacterized repeat protein (TIGR01451 family)